MTVRLFALALMLTLVSIAEAIGQSKPTLVVNVFFVASGVSCPYDMNQLKLATIGELIQKDGQHFFVVPEPPSQGEGGVVYTLGGEVLEWHPGNRAKRLLVGMGSGRETAKIHYWLIDISGKKVFDHTDTIRQSFSGNPYAGSVGQLAQPFADKIAERLKAAKLTRENFTTNDAAQYGRQAKGNN
jgi:hypothetical protein